MNNTPESREQNFAGEVLDVALGFVVLSVALMALFGLVWIIAVNSPDGLVPGLPWTAS